MNKNIIYIFVLWSLLIFVSYNVLTVEASEKEDKKVCKEYGGKWKETIIVDVDGNEKGSGERQCQFDNDKDRQAYSVRPGYSLDGTGPDGEYGRLDLDMSDDEAAAIEDDICDNEDADTTDIKLCMSEDRKQKNEKEREWYYNENTGSYEYLTDKEIKDHNLESESGIKQGEKWGPEYEIVPPSEPYPTAEDWGNTVTDEEQQRYQEEQEYQQVKHEQLAHQYTEEEQKEMNDAIEEAASNDSESEEEEQDEPEQEEEEESDDNGDESSEENNE